MSLSPQNISMIKIIIHVFPGNEKLTHVFDGNKSFADLKDDLLERQIIKKGTYYAEMNDNILNDDMILKGNGVKNDSEINIVRNDCIKIKVETRDKEGEIQIISKYFLISDFKVIKTDKNNEVKVCINHLLLYFV